MTKFDSEEKGVPPQTYQADIENFIPDKRNANRGTARGRGMLQHSLQELGAGRSILLDKHGNIIAGNKTAETANDIGITNVLVVKTRGDQLVAVQREDLDLYGEDGVARRLAYADNRVAQVSLDFDPNIILQDLEKINLADFFFENELEEILKGANLDPVPMSDDSDVEPQIDRAAELNEKWQVSVGDVWHIGQHRLVCGDSSDRATIERLMNGKVASLLLTDPPYGINRDKGFSGSGGFDTPIPRRQYNDDWESERPNPETLSLILGFAKQAIIFGGNFFADILPQGNHWIVWDKQNTMPTFGDCELAWTNIPRNSVKMYTVAYNGLIGRETERFHPTQKPVKLFNRLLEDYSLATQIVFDPYLGSGTTMVASESVGCICYGMEISPNYCAVILERMGEAFPELDIYKTQ